MPLGENAGEAQGIKATPTSEKNNKKYQKKYGSHFRISRYDYKIIYCDLISYNDQPCHGLCDPETRTIYIDVNSESLEETIVHEILHAEVHEGGFKGADGWNDDLEEVMIQQLAKAVTHHFRILRL